MRIIIHSKTHGVYLQYSFGGAFFSFVPTIYSHAMTFADEAEAREFARHNESDSEFPNDLEFLPVDTDAAEATMAECVAAGVKPWEVRHVEPFKFDFSAADVGHRTFLGSSREGMHASMDLVLAEYKRHGGKVFIFDKGMSSDIAPKFNLTGSSEEPEQFGMGNNNEVA